MEPEASTSSGRVSARAIFDAAQEIESPQQRQAYVSEACAGNRVLRDRVEGLLRAYSEAGSFLETPAISVMHASVLKPSDSMASAGQEGQFAVAAGATIARRYRLLELIGEGGMGAVWMAEQREPVKRRVALKLIKAGMDSRSVLARFEAERQALALMDHPNIARVLDGGTTEGGYPFFVMEMVKGIPLVQYCDERKLSIRERLTLFVQICQAVQHAHQKGIIHRDLKPGNILVTEMDGQPLPKVIDFGLAKALQGTETLTEHTLFTIFGGVLGTPLYMAPEQVGINALDVDTRTDIYALGVILYELLTGTTPLESRRFKEAAWDEIRRLIREEDAPRPSTRLLASDTSPPMAASRQTESARLAKLVRGELDWIVLKALEKDRSRRYQTAMGLARDLERFLSDEPVEACPPSATYRLGKFARRNRGMLLGGGALMAMLVLLVAGLAVSNRLIARERNQKAAALVQAQAQRQRAEENFLKARIAIRELMTQPAMGWGQWSGLTPELRQMFTQRATNYYESLIREDASDPSLQYETAVGYRSLASLHENTRSFAQAEKLSRQSIAILERLSGESPDVAEYRHQLGCSLWKLAQVLAQTNRPAELEAAYRRSLNLYEQLCVEKPDVFDYPEMFIAVSNAFGERLLSENRLEEAELAYRRSLDRYAGWAGRLAAPVPGIDATCARMPVILAATRTPSEAANAFESIRPLAPDNHDLWLWAAALQLRAGHLEQYRRICREMLERFSRVDDPAIAERTVKACALAPNTADDPGKLLSLADRALSGTQAHPYRWHFEITAGLAAYRAGRHDVAVTWLTNVSPQVERGWPWDATMLAVLAMAKHGLNQQDEAQRALTGARQIITRNMPALDQDRILAAGDWRDWFHAQVLHQEADQLLRSKE